MKIFIGNINEYTVQFLSGLVSGERLDRSMKYRFEADRKRSLLAYALLSHAIAGVYPDISLPVMPETDEYGKPHLYFNTNTVSDKDAEIHFSVSHSGDYAACVLNKDPVGIDIETIGKPAGNIAEHFFARDELGFIHDNESFYRIWTLKESFLKVVGLGMLLPLDAFCITDFDEHSGSCGFRLNRSSRSSSGIITDPGEALHKNLLPFVTEGSYRLNLTGRSVTTKDGYALAIVSPVIPDDHLNIIKPELTTSS